jgi:hypothetical protein
MTKFVEAFRSAWGVSLAVVAAVLAALLLAPLPADEGQWLPEQLKNLDWPELRGRGLELEADEIWDGNQGLLSAVVSLGGCSASFVSDQGLVVTNHHCGFGAINRASTLEHNYLENGFVSDSMADEIPDSGMTVSFVTGYDDVTAQMHAAADEAGDNPADKYAAVQKMRGQLASEAKSEFSEAIVVSYLEGRMWRRIHRTVLRDVRLVYAPPRSVGEYGGETDNWMWPRHTGDFSFFRAYVSPDGKPAKYAEDNVPYNPPRHLLVSEEGADDGDLVMVLGYPGRTSRYLTSTAVAVRQEFYYPARLQLFSTLIDGLEEQAAESDEMALRLASRIKSYANVEKNARGMIFGLERNDVVFQKEFEEAQFMAWVDENDGRRDRYGDAIQRLFDMDEVAAKRMPKDFVLDGLRRYSSSFRAAQAEKQVTLDTPDAVRDVLLDIADQLPDGNRLRSFDQWKKKGSGELVALAKALEPEYKAQSVYRQHDAGERLAIGNLWIEAQELWRGERFYPDANSTLRVSMASVKGYEPRDGIWHVPHTSVKGMLEKHTGGGDFDVPDQIFEKVKTDSSALKIPVCFLSNADTTGGNSGSPVVDGKGRLVGLNFDRVFENVAGDFGWNAERSRNISVDIRYVLWLMREVWPAPRLLEEMKVATEHKSDVKTAPALELRVGLKQGDAGFDSAEKIDYKGGHLHLGLSHKFLLKSLAVEEFVDGGFAVSIEVEDREGLLQLTGKYVGRPMAIVGWNNKILSVPVIQSAIPGRLLLQGGSKGFTADEAESIVEEINRCHVFVGSGDFEGVEYSSTNRGKPTVEFAFVLGHADDGYDKASRITFEGQEYALGKVHSYEVKSVAWTKGVSDAPALAFSVLDSEGFKDLTTKNSGNRVAVMVAGKVFTIPVIEGGLPGRGIIAGGREGFTDAQVELLQSHFPGLGPVK